MRDRIEQTMRLMRLLLLASSLFFMFPASTQATLTSQVPNDEQQGEIKTKKQDEKRRNDGRNNMGMMLEKSHDEFDRRRGYAYYSFYHVMDSSPFVSDGLKTSMMSTDEYNHHNEMEWMRTMTSPAVRNTIRVKNQQKHSGEQEQLEQPLASRTVVE